MMPNSDALIYIESVTDWLPVVARANTMLDASELMRQYRFGLKEDLGVEFRNQVLTYRNGFATYIRSKSEIESLVKGPLLEVIQDLEKMRVFAERGHKALEESDVVIGLATKLKTFDDLREHGSNIISAIQNSIHYVTLVPYWVMGTLDKNGYSLENPGPYAELFTLFEPLRADTRILNFIETLYPSICAILAVHTGCRNPKIFESMTLPEFERVVSAKNVPEESVLAARSAGCVVWFPENSEQLSFESSKDVFQLASSLGTTSTITNELRGNVAYKGFVRGRVKIIFNTADAQEFSDGDIVVSSSTSPALMPYLKRCGGIVTDEGGIGSHAAIISRELKKPCIIGTKFATQVLKDGDMVEVDADKGVVTRLSQD